MQKESFGSAKIFWSKLSREELLRLLAERLPELQQKLPLVLVILFGSYAKGNYTAGSDVDLLVVYQRKTPAGCLRDRLEDFAYPQP